MKPLTKTLSIIIIGTFGLLAFAFSAECYFIWAKWQLNGAPVDFNPIIDHSELLTLK